MGAVTTTLRAHLILFSAVTQDMIDALQENNMRAWKRTDQEVTEEIASQVTFNAAAAIANDTGTNGGSPSADVTTTNSCITAMKDIEGAFRPLIVALNDKKWNEVNRLLRVNTFSDAITAFSSAHQAIGASSTAGADETATRTATDDGEIVIDHLLSAIEQRIKKDYKRTTDFLELAITAQATYISSVNSIPNNGS